MEESSEKKERNPHKNLKILETLLREQKLNEEQKREVLEKIAKLKSEINIESNKVNGEKSEN